MDVINTTDYLYLVLVPSARAFRGQWDEGKAPFKATKNAKQCRVEFVSKSQEKLWQKFCVDNELKNDTSLEY